MANEKMMILKMLEEGKINAEEAARLMEASEGKSSSAEINKKRAAMSDAGNYEWTEPYRKTPYDGEGRQNRHARHGEGQYPGGRATQGVGLDDLASELGRKFDSLTRDMEPKLHRLAETVVETTATMADKLSKSINNINVSGESGSPRLGGQIEHNFEIKVAPGYCELNFSAFNGNITVNGYNGDKITAKVYCRKKNSVAGIELIKLGDKYFLSYDEEDFFYVGIDAYVPESMFKNIRLETKNGKIKAETLEAMHINLVASNGGIDMKNVKCANLKAGTDNGFVNLTNIQSDNAVIDMFNGNFTGLSTDIANLKLYSSNGSVTINMDYYRRFRDYTWVLEAANGKFIMNLPSLAELGYHIKAQTSLNSVKLGLIGMDYIINDANFVEAKSYNFGETGKTIKIKAETSNAPLVIN